VIEKLSDRCSNLLLGEITAIENSSGAQRWGIIASNPHAESLQTLAAFLRVSPLPSLGVVAVWADYQQQPVTEQVAGDQFRWWVRLVVFTHGQGWVDIGRWS
jgi:hypothetical protein